MVGKLLMSAGVALALGSAPVAASAAPVANTALTTGKSVRAGSSHADASKLSGGVGVIGIVILAGVIAIGVIAAVNGDDDDLPDSP